MIGIPNQINQSDAIDNQTFTGLETVFAVGLTSPIV